MLTPTIKVGRDLLWLDESVLPDCEFKLDRESLSAQCNGCGRDIVESGKLELRLGPNGAVKCKCGEWYPIIWRDVR